MRKELRQIVGAFRVAVTAPGEATKKRKLKRGALDLRREAAAQAAAVREKLSGDLSPERKEEGTRRLNLYASLIETCDAIIEIR